MLKLQLAISSHQFHGTSRQLRFFHVGWNHLYDNFPTSSWFNQPTVPLFWIPLHPCLHIFMQSVLVNEIRHFVRGVQTVARSTVGHQCRQKSIVAKTFLIWKVLPNPFTVLHNGNCHCRKFSWFEISFINSTELRFSSSNSNGFKILAFALLSVILV